MKEMKVVDGKAETSYKTLLFVCCAISFGSYSASYMRLPVVPLYARSLDIPTAQIGVINSAFFLMAGLLSLPSGMLSDRVGCKRVAAFGLVMLTLSSFLLCFSETFSQLTFVYLLFGVGIAAFGPTMMSYVADISPPTHLGRSYGWYTTALFGGMSVGPAIGGFVAQEFGFLRVFFISGIFIFLNFWALVIFFPSSPSADKRQKKAVVVKMLFKNRTLIACWLTAIGGCFGLGMFITFIPLHAQNQGLNVGEIGLVFSAQAISNALSRIPFGYLSDRIGRRSLLVIIGFIGVAAAMAGFGISATIWHFIMFAVAVGVGMGLAFTSVGALIAEVVPSEARGFAMGGYNTCIYLGMMLNAAFMGTVIQAVGFRYAFFIVASEILFFISVFYFLIKDFKKLNV
jgi:MFS family permease